MNNKGQYEGVATIILLIIVAIGAAILFFGYPIYNVWGSEQSGRAELARAEYNRQIAVVEAQQKKESATYLAEAEVIRAQGVAKANEIIGRSLANNTAYLDYLWLTEKITASDKEVIYVPTEAQLPILEANRLKND